jgi:protocatechuate 3,4-dioxygenase beta subunit
MSKDDPRRAARHRARRRVLTALGAIGATEWVKGAWAQAPAGRGSVGCVLTPAQTEGPYFVDERLERSDIRSDPADGSVREGALLALALTVSEVSGSSCRPIAGALVDLWHCDAAGVYSDVDDPRARTLGRKFLRGHQVTDNDGRVRFVTIYPGWYPGRTVHVHFKVRTSSAGGVSRELTSQLYFDDALTDRVYARAPYVRRGARSTRNEGDWIYRRGGSRLQIAVAEAAEGYAGTFDIGLRAA